MVKLNELSLELLPHPPSSPDLAPSDFCYNEEVIAETEAYFESKDESFYKKRIEKLEKHWNECITVEGNYVDE